MTPSREIKQSKMRNETQRNNFGTDLLNKLVSSQLKMDELEIKF